MAEFFTRGEFACKCGCDPSPVVDYELLEVLTDVRRVFGPVSINSGVRCVTHNKAVGGSSHSQHLLGRAADIRVSGVSPEEVQTYLKATYPNSLGIGSYGTFTHVDSRPAKARWNG